MSSKASLAGDPEHQLAVQRWPTQRFGVTRPVLMWPAGRSERLNDAQIAGIVAHELEHVRRRDKLTAMLHCLVEVHPAVW